MQGLEWDDPLRIRTWKELIRWVNEVGFLPLFKNGIPGESWDRITERLREIFPDSEENEIIRVIGKRPAV